MSGGAACLIADRRPILRPMNAATWTPVRHKYTVDDYYRQAEAGILHPDTRTELIYGEIYDRTPPGSRHSTVVNRLNRILSIRLVGRAIVQVQNPIRIDRYSQPEPDLALLKPADHEYWDALPTGADVLLLIEVGDSSALFDRRVKATLYAEGDVQEFWSIDLKGAAYVFRNPAGGEYRETAIVERGGTLHACAFPDLAIRLDELI